MFFSCKSTSQISESKILNECNVCEKIPTEIREWIEIDSSRLLSIAKFANGGYIFEDTLFIGSFYDTDANIGSGSGYGFIFNSKRELYYKYHHGEIKYLETSMVDSITMSKIKNWETLTLINQSNTMNNRNRKTKSMYPFHISKIEFLEKNEIKVSCFHFLYSFN